MGSDDFLLQMKNTAKSWAGANSKMLFGAAIMAFLN
jgi:hypothetical protein